MGTHQLFFPTDCLHIVLVNQTPRFLVTPVISFMQQKREIYTVYEERDKPSIV